MTEPSAADRLAALRARSMDETGATNRTRGRRSPAHTSKVLAGGISVTAVFAMVAAMGWETGSSSAQSAAPPESVVESSVAPTTLPVPPTAVPLVPVATTIVVPVAVPVTTAVPQPTPVAVVSNTTTKASS